MVSQPTYGHGGNARNDERNTMTNGATDRPDAHRLELFRSVFEPSSLDDVAEAVAVASEDERRIYIERVDGGYRWSLTHPGGGYPLLRITARFLRVDYTRIMVVCSDPANPTSAEAWAVVEFDGATSSDLVGARIQVALASDT
jgi:hypothetical protein